MFGWLVGVNTVSDNFYRCFKGCQHENFLALLDKI